MTMNPKEISPRRPEQEEKLHGFGLGFPGAVVFHRSTNKSDV
jgi:hypothetical protein